MKQQWGFMVKVKKITKSVPFGKVWLLWKSAKEIIWKQASKKIGINIFRSFLKKGVMILIRGFKDRFKSTAKVMGQGVLFNLSVIYINQLLLKRKKVSGKRKCII